MTHPAAPILAPRGTLRAGINLQNPLLVSGRDANGDPVGVAPDMARKVAERLGVPLRFVGYETAKTLGQAIVDDAWDIGFLGADPARATHIAFTAPYCGIEATYLVQERSDFHHVTDVDRPGVRIASAAGSAYDLWLAHNLRHASLVHAPTIAGSREAFLTQALDALAGLRTWLLTDTPPSTRLLDGRFTSVEQAIGTRRNDREGLAFLQSFIEDALRSGLVAGLIDRYGATGFSVPA